MARKSGPNNWRGSKRNQKLKRIGKGTVAGQKGENWAQIIGAGTNYLGQHCRCTKVSVTKTTITKRNLDLTFWQ